jgi:hypothetical protein
MSTRDSGEYALFNLRLSVGTLDRIHRYRTTSTRPSQASTPTPAWPLVCC